MFRYDLLILTCGPSGCIVPCLESIREYSQNYRVIWLDNNSPKEVSERAVRILYNIPHIRVRSPENIGIAKGYNTCLALSTAPYVVVMNDDITVTKDWLPNTERLFHLGEKVGIATPSVSRGGWIQASALNAPRNDYILGTRGIPMYCTMISRECIEDVGYFDEKLKHGCGCDDDFCIRAKKLNYKTAVDLRTVVKHEHQASSLHILGGGAEKQKKHLEAAKYLKEKHR